MLELGTAFGVNFGNERVVLERTTLSLWPPSVETAATKVGESFC